MGVPSFYRWVAEKYAKVVVDCVEADPELGLPDAALPNPNGIEYDCLYLDMNGIIHPCARPEGKPPPSTEEEMFAAICAYIDRLFSIVRPRRLLFMAIDGPAPRAKMNQQRTRRFKAAKERADKTAEAAALRAELRSNGRVPPPPSDKVSFDSNVITPGTTFMARLAKWLRYYVQVRLNSASGWQGLRVILSDASVPGEGEHKVMEHIRQQRVLPGYNPNTRHVIHGLDADLIMLALATHEPHFAILREVVLDRKAKEKQDKEIANGKVVGPPKMQFLQIWVLREYLAVEFSQADWSSVPGGFDLERVVDDFVFMCFFVGNDFLPHLPAIEIRDGAIDMLICAYKLLLPQFGGYLSDAGRVHLPRTELLLREVASYEEEIFGRQRRREEGRERAMRARQVAEGGEAPAGAFGGLYPPKDPTQKAMYEAMKAFASKGYSSDTISFPPPGTRELSGFHKASAHLYVQLLNLGESTGPNKEIVIRHKKPAAGGGGGRSAGGAFTSASGAMGGDDSAAAEAEGEVVADFEERLALRLAKKEEEDAQVPDEVRFGEHGWKDRYYACKLHAQPGDDQLRRYVVKCYVEGLCWVLMYYYQGVQDWGWFYPFHYAPCSSDLVELDEFAGGRFDVGAPFTPFQQLMAVFPPASGHALPEAYRTLMVHPSSPIIDFYPIDFRNDLNGKKFIWQAIALLPFIDAKRLRTALEPLALTLTEEETERNTHGSELLFASGRTPLGAHMTQHLRQGEGASPLILDPTSMSSPSFGGTIRHSGSRCGLAGDTLPAPPDGEDWGMPPISACQVSGGLYTPPPYAVHTPRLLSACVLPPMTLTANDRPNFSRDSEQACRSMMQKFQTRRGGGGGGRHQPGYRGKY
jgi:5'-3' exoribonuclease 2